MKLSKWLRSASLLQLSLVGMGLLSMLPGIVGLPIAYEAEFMFLAGGAMVLNVIIMAFLWLPVLRAADGVGLVEDAAADPERIRSAVWLLGSHFKRTALLVLAMPLVMVLVFGGFALVDWLGYDVIWSI